MTPRRTRASLVLLAFLGIGVAAATPQSAPEPPAVPRAATPPSRAEIEARAAASFDVEKVADGVYALIRTTPLGIIMSSNIVFIVNAEDVVVVDTGLTTIGAEAAVAALRRITPKPVRYIVNTHRHADHVNGNQTFLAAYPGAEVIGHSLMRADLLAKGEETLKGWAGYAADIAREMPKSLAAGKNIAGAPISPEERANYESDLRLAEELDACAPSLRVTAPTLTVDDALILHRGARTIEIRALGRGHTHGDLVVWLPVEGVVATGDLLVAPVPLIGSDQAYIGDWAKTLDRILELHPGVIVPGHGPVFRDDTYARLYRDLLLSADRQARAAIARGETAEEAAKSLNLDEFRRKMAGPDPELRFLFDRFGAGPVVGAVYREVSESAAPAPAR